MDLKVTDGPFSIIGKPTPMIDARDKVLGRADFASDLSLPRMLFGKVLRSPHPHARIRDIDTTRAERLPGVKVVLAGKDIPQVRWGHEVNDQTTLALDRVRFIGEEVAAVAAVDEATALDALELIRVEYEPLPAVFDPEEALQPGAPLVHEDHPGNVAHEFRFSRGDVEAGFRQAAAVYENTFRTNVQYQAYMEPIGSMATVDPSGKVTVWASTQSVYFTRSRVAKALGVPESRVRVIQPFVGGGFGGKLNDEPNAQICALLALRAGRPVKLINTRLDEFQGSRPRVPAVIRLRMGARRDGTLCAKETDIISDNGAYTGRSVKIMAVTAMRIDNCYRLENLRTRARLVYTHKLPTGAFRGLGNPQKIFAFESALDHLAIDLGMDPVEIRLVNAIRTGETSVHGWKIGSCGLRDCLEETAARSGFRGKWGRSRGEGSKRRGIGIANAIHVSGNRHYTNWDGATAIVKLNQDGRANLICGEGDIGQGGRTVLAQICAEEMGLRLSDIEMAWPDTDTTPMCMGAFASRLTLISGNAVRRAAAQARQQLLEGAGEILEVRPEDLDIKEGVIFHRSSPEKQIPVADVCRDRLFRQGGEPILAQASFDTPTEVAHPETRYGNPACAYTFCTEVAEVEVDTETGQVAVVGFWAADDVGRTLNPLTAEGQIQGAVVQGLGYALYENWVVQDGRVISGNLADYSLPKAEGLPPIESLLIESIESNGPFGAKGASETAIDPTAAAVANAIFDAVGVRVTSLPITPQSLLALLRAKGRPPEGAGR